MQLYVMMPAVKKQKKKQRGAECCLYENIVECVLSRSSCKTKMYKDKPGWNVYVEELHAEARRSFRAWVESGWHKKWLSV